MENKTFAKIPAGIVIAIILALGLILFWAGFFIASGKDGEDSTSPTDQTSSIASDGGDQDSTKVGRSGKTVSEDKKDALASAQSVLSLAAKSPDGSSAEDRVNSLEDGDSSVVDKELPKKMRFTGEFKSDKGLQNNTYQALITLSSYLSSNSTDVKPVDDEAWKKVYVDQDAGIAYVPVSLFYGPGASFSLEMVYTNGEWKLLPYSLLDIINLSATLQQGSQSSDSETN